MSKKFLRQLTTVILVGLGLVAVAYGAYLVLIGPSATFVTSDGGAATSIRFPTLAGLIPVVGGLLVAAGGIQRRRGVVWSGAGVLAVFVVLGMFSVGPVLAPVVLLVLATLALDTVVSRMRAPAP
jgi:hypothetical protein